MKILESYLWKSLILNILITWLALTTLDSFFSYLKEVSNPDPNSQYGNLQALIYIGYLLPNTMYTLFPTATLIGALMGLGQLAATREIIAMRAAGLSLKNIMFSTLKLGVLMTVLIFFFGEEIAPQTKLKGESFKIEMERVGQAYTEAGVWVKEGKQIIHIGKAWSRKKFSDVEIYEVDAENSRFGKITRAETANRQGSNWQLHNVTVEQFHKDGINIVRFDDLTIDSLVSSKLMEITSVKATQLSAHELSDYIKHQDKNDLNTVQLEQAYWQRYSLPISTLVMLIIAMPFAFGSQRSSGAGQLLFLGILIGVTFFLINRAAGNIGIVYGFSPVVSAFTPLLMFLGLGLVLLKRVR